jgi:hypothetical protein
LQSNADAAAAAVADAKSAARRRRSWTEYIKPTDRPTDGGGGDDNDDDDLYGNKTRLIRRKFSISDHRAHSARVARQKFAIMVLYIIIVITATAAIDDGKVRGVVFVPPDRAFKTKCTQSPGRILRT